VHPVTEKKQTDSPLLQTSYIHLEHRYRSSLNLFWLLYITGLEPG